MERIHGGDWMHFRECFGGDVLDFSANVSPLGLPAGVAQAILEALPHADRYPDPRCRTLRAALSEAEQVPPAWILCGNGAADLIYRFVWAVRPRRALVPVPTFTEYTAALETVGCTVVPYPLEEANDFLLTERFLSAVGQDIDLVFLCQPNNPTGQVTNPALVQALLARCQACGARLALDECFLDFLPDRRELTAKPLLAEANNLLIFKAFTKLYGMAGVRLGYCLCADTALLEAMSAVGPPWAVSALAEAAGVAALRETDYTDRVRQLIATQRPLVAAGLRRLGLRVVDGKANYLLFRAPEALGPACAAHGVMLRSCASFVGLDATWYRTAIRTPAENRQLLTTIEEALSREETP